MSGNPVSYYGAGSRRWTMAWKNGKELASATASGRTVSYEYDKNGLRTSKTYNGTKYSYAYAGDKLIWQGWNGNELYFFYNASGEPLAFRYVPSSGSSTTGYYYTNQFGDVVRIEDGNGTVLAKYSYDAWGKVYSSTGSLNSINPLRYRGYYYDTETGFYYLQSRYYDPTVSRFINADSFASTGQGFLGYNMFAYCGNNPVSCSDPSGHMMVPYLPMLDGSGAGGTKGRGDSISDKIEDTAWAFLQSATISGGVGTGLQGSFHISPIVISGGAKVDILAAEILVGKGVRIGQRGDAGVSLGLDDPFDKFHIEKSESFFKSYLNYGWCPTHGWTWCECPNYEDTTEERAILGISGSVYVIGGISFCAGFDLNYFWDQVVLIWN